jgi:predicted CoA-substrate-specific enzyme activase
MTKKKLLAGIDAGHIATKAIIMRNEEILGYCTSPTGYDVVAAAQTALKHASDNAGISFGEISEVVATGIFKDRIEAPSLRVTKAVAEYFATIQGALFLDKNSRIVIDIGGNIHKAVRYDQNGRLLDVIQNDKCADGLGIFYTHMARYFERSERELSALALSSTHNLSIAIQCALSAESDAIDLIFQGKAIEDVADAIAKFVAERVADMSTYLSLTEEIVVAGGLAKSEAIIQHLAKLIKQDVGVLKHPQYVGAIGAVISYEGEK